MELPLRVPQQQRARQRQQQHRFSGCVYRFAEASYGPQHSSIALVAGQNWQVEICQACLRRVQTYSGDAPGHPKIKPGQLFW